MSGRSCAARTPVDSPPISLETSVEFVNLSDAYRCGSCMNVLRDPQQTSCGHRLCQLCLMKHFAEKGDPSMCPYGESDCEMISSHDKTVYPDFVLRRELKKSLVYCVFKQQGCQETVPWGNLHEHRHSCEFGRVTCPYEAMGCEERILPDEMQTHKEKCDFQPQICSQCNQEILRGKIQEHLKTSCSMVMVPCPYECGHDSIPRGELEVHAKRCPKKPRDCKFKNMGCTFMDSSDKVKEHEKDSMCHLEVIWCLFLQLQHRISSVEMRFQELDNERATTTGQNNLSEAIGAVDQAARRTETRLRETQKVSAKHQEEISSVKQSLTELSSFQTVLTQLQGRISVLEGKGGTGSAPTVKEDSFQQLERTVNVRFRDVDLRMQVMETASYDGTLIWKIRDYRTRRQDAMNGGILSLYSQPFYTSRHGYKMCARVYLNGDGMGKETHMSLFFVVMRSDFDALIPWPFRQKVTLMLMDQSGGSRHLTDTFKPDPSSSSFQKPRTDMNVASGCPLFVSHSVLEAKDSLYLRDDTLYIKVMVDVSTLMPV